MPSKATAEPIALPASAEAALARVVEFGFKFTYDADTLLPGGEDDRMQMRDARHNAPQAKVAELRAAYKRGDEVPPVVLTRDGKYVDGNTRGAALRKNGIARSHAIILDVDSTDPRESVQRRLLGLAAALNLRHGKVPDGQETARAIMALQGVEGLTEARVADLLGLPAGRVRRVLGQRAGRDKLETLGFTPNGTPGSVLELLGSRRFAALNSEPQRTIADLAMKAGLDSSDVRALVAAVEAAESDEQAKAKLSEAAESLEDRIAQVRLIGKSRPTPAGKVRRALGIVLGVAEANPALAVEVNTATRGVYLDELRRTCATIGHIIAAHEDDA